MTPEQLEKTLLRYADSDMRRAREAHDHAIAITDTKRGLLELRYDPSYPAAPYLLVTQGIHSETVALGKAGKVRRALANVYTVEVK